MPEKLTLKMIGEHTLHCAGCERTVEFALSRLPGVRQVRADHKTQIVEIVLISSETDLANVQAELDWIGYQVEPVPAPGDS